MQKAVKFEYWFFSELLTGKEFIKWLLIEELTVQLSPQVSSAVS